MKASKYIVMSMGLALAGASLVGAQAAPQAPVPPRAALPTAPAAIELTAQENAVIDQLHAANVLELAAAKLAIKNAESRDVRRYGEHLLRDHTKADRELTTVAKRNGAKLADVDNAKIDDLKGRRGTDFDRAFLDMMIRDHQASIDTVRSAQNQAQNPDIKALLNKTLPTLEKHEQDAQQLVAGKS
jgi:putative membrane protein